MRLEFQKIIASSPFTLPVVSAIVILLWIIMPVAHEEHIDTSQYGLWTLLSSEFAIGYFGKYLALLVSAIGIYLVAELNNAFILLRISSRMLSSTLALFLGIILCVHVLDAGLVLMVCTVLSFFAFFGTYQTEYSLPTFLAYFFLSLGSLFFPKLLYLIPLYFGCQVYLHTLSPRILLASLFGILVPYWFFLGVAVRINGGFTFFLDTCKEIFDLHLPDYTTLQVSDYIIFVFVVIFTVFGIVDFYANAYKDKTRTRILYNVIIAHTVYVTLYVMLQPQYFHTLLPLLLVDSSLVGGHYLALTYTKFTRIYCLALLFCILVLLIVQL